VGLAGRSHKVRQRRLACSDFVPRCRALGPCGARPRPAQFGTPGSSHSVTDLGHTPAASPPPLYPHSARMQGFLGTDPDPQAKRKGRSSMRGIKCQAPQDALASFGSSRALQGFPLRQTAMPSASHRSSSFRSPRHAMHVLQQDAKQGSEGEKKVGCLGQSGCACIALASSTRRGLAWSLGGHFFFLEPRPLVGGSRQAMEG
jgi:hypothetical protein